MNWIINMAVKFSGLGWLWEKIDGYKTYIGAAGKMLSGLGMMFGAAAAEADAFVANVHSVAEAYRFIEALFKHPDPPAVAFSAGWGLVLWGWSKVAEKHAADKRHEELLAAAAPAPQNAPAPTPAAQP